MDKDILEKHTNDPTWAEVIRLYSGLFDTKDEREDFILDLAEKDILLAAECKTSSVDEEIVLTLSIEKKISINSIDTNESAKSILALLEINKFEKLKSIFIFYKHKRSILPNVFSSIAYNFDNDKFITLYSVFVSINHRLSTKEKKSIRNFFRELISKNMDIRKYFNILINSASSSNITELRKIANEVPFDIDMNIDIVQTIKRLIKENKPLSIKQALVLINQHSLDKDFDVKNIITKLMKFNTSFSKKHAQTFISKYKLENEFPQSTFVNTEQEIQKLLNEANHKSLKQAIKLIRQNDNEELINLIRDFLNSNPSFIEFANKQVIHYRLLNRFSEFKQEQITIDKPKRNSDKDTVISEITKIIPSRIFVKIENETRSASIYIGELANKRINNILDFEYNGVKLHVGQKLIAKVINIDKQGRINLSLKQVQNEE